MSDKPKSAGQLLLESVFKRLVYHNGYPAQRSFVLWDWSGTSIADKQAMEEVAFLISAPLHQRISELESQLSEREPWNDEANQDCFGNGGITCPHCGHVE